MTVIVVLVYIGGLCFDPGFKVGLLKRLFWPGYLGEKLFAWTFDGKQP